VAQNSSASRCKRREIDRRRIPDGELSATNSTIAKRRMARLRELGRTVERG
jgi:hypothetical protein